RGGLFLWRYAGADAGSSIGGHRRRQPRHSLGPARGVSLATHWAPRALLLAAGLIVIVRPAATWLLLTHSPTNRLQRLLSGWFGIRGIGSIYYLAFALTHGVAGTFGRELADMTISIVVVSIVVHGLTSQPLMMWYDRQQSRRARSQESEDS